jgi:very-short-patch-repair endonuclease
MRWLPEDDPRRQVWERCESPIEQTLCVTLFASFGFSAIEGDFSSDRLAELVSDKPTAFLFAQQWIAGYRADFLLVVADHEGCVLFVIECDGSQFHSTDDQRAYDARRDAALRQAGCRKVFRFSGSDIFRHTRLTANSLFPTLAELGIAPEEGAGCEPYLNILRTLEAEPRQPLRDLRREQFEEKLAAIRREDATWM